MDPFPEWMHGCLMVVPKKPKEHIPGTWGKTITELTEEPVAQIHIHE